MLIRYLTRWSRHAPDPSPDSWTPGHIASVVIGTLVFLTALSASPPTGLSGTPPVPSWARIPAPASVETSTRTPPPAPACPPGPADLINAMGALEGQPPVPGGGRHACR